MKLLHICTTLTFIVSGITVTLHGSSTPRQALPSLGLLATRFIAKQIQNIVKVGMRQQTAPNAIIEQTKPWSTGLTREAIGMIKTELLRAYAIKTYKASPSLNKEQLFDGRIISIRDQVHPREDRKNDPYFAQSPWAVLTIDQLILAYYTVRQAQKNGALHPLNSVTLTHEFTEEDDEEPFLLAQPAGQNGSSEAR